MENSLTSEVQRLSGENIDLCYHCHKCTAGCPVVQSMTYGPDRMLRMVALDQRDALATKPGYLAVRRLLYLRHPLSE